MGQVCFFTYQLGNYSFFVLVRCVIFFLLIMWDGQSCFFSKKNPWISTGAPLIEIIICWCVFMHDVSIMTTTSRNVRKGPEVFFCISVILMTFPTQGYHEGTLDLIMSCIDQNTQHMHRAISIICDLTLTLGSSEKMAYKS